MKGLKDRDLLIKVISIAVILILGFVVLQKVHQARLASLGKQDIKGIAAKAPAKAQVKKPAQPVKKALPAIPKGKGELIVKIMDSQARPVQYRINLFKALDSRNCVYAGTMTSNVPQVLDPARYDLVIMTQPNIIHKNVAVAKGRRNEAKLGRLTGSLMVKITDSAGSPARYPLRATNIETPSAVTKGTTSTAMELFPGGYDVQVSTNPVQEKKGTRVVRGKETIIDLGDIVGSINVKSKDAQGKDVRYPVRVKITDSNKIVVGADTNRKIELVEGVYDIEVLSKPEKLYKKVAVKRREEVVLE